MKKNNSWGWLGPIMTMIMFGAIALAGKSGETIWGDSVVVGAGTARSFVETGPYHQVSSMGIELTYNALNGLPNSDTEYLLNLPNTIDTRPFDHIVINWNPKGHDPNGIYSVPHFDYHFYLITRAQQLAITCRGADAAICMKQPPAEIIPENYIPEPEGMPQMGWHWVDSTASEFHGSPFTTTLIYGYYDGKQNFFEPMITRQFLLDRKMFAAPITLPQRFAQPGNYPTSYSVDIDEHRKVYRIVLQNFTRHLKDSTF